MAHHSPAILALAAALAAGLMPIEDAPMTSPADTAGLRVTGRRLDHHGQRVIPKAMFGVHSFPMTPEQAAEYGIESARTITQRVDGNPVVPGTHPEVAANVGDVVDCIYDRYQPALILTRGDWEAHLAGLAAAFAAARRQGAWPRTLEFWNEPYLNWASKPGVNYDARHFVQTPDGADGTPTLRLAATGEAVTGLVPGRQMLAVRPADQAPHYLASRYALDYRSMGKSQAPDGTWVPFRWEEGFAFHFRGEACELRTLPWYRDPTQVSYYSGAFNANLYNRMLLAFAGPLKQAAPEILLVAGWDCNLWWDGWNPWRVLCRPMIDQAQGLIDGVAEHHYGCDTRMVGAQYELVHAYAKTRHGKDLKLYNTEAGGTADPEQPGNYQPNGTQAAPVANFTYMLRDVLHLLRHYPDKAAARAFHQPQNSPGGLDAFRFLKELRGDLLEVTPEAPGVWPVAARDGKRLCLVVFNDRRQALDLPVRIDAPAGMVIDRAVRVVPGVDAAGKVVLAETPVLVGVRDTKARDLARIPPMGAVKYLVELRGDGSPQPVAVRRQFYAQELLFKVTDEASATLAIAIPAADLAGATDARLRLVHNRIGPENAEVRVNGTSLDIGLQGECWTSEIPVPVAALRADNHIELRAKPGQSFEIVAASLIVFTETER